jgi:CubicO group peptidase (beta-lactamase class C family)
LFAAGSALATEPEPARADAAIHAYVEREGIPAAHVTILRGDTVLLQRGYGAARPGGPPPDALSIFPLGSISKQFTAALVIVADDRPATFRLRLPQDGSHDRFEFDWADVRSYAYREQN